MTNALEFASQTACQAGELLLNHFTSKSFNTHMKADNSAVTSADLAADRLISQAITHAYPEELLLSEELQTVLPPHMLQAPKAAWIIDPLDGTSNFSFGLHIWGVLITRLINGWPDTTVLYFPLLDELYSAQSGQGAFLNGQPIEVEPPDTQNALSCFACCSRTYRRYRVNVPYKLRVLGSAAYTYCAVARGMAILGFEATPKIWDIAGAWLLVREAGGMIETLDGSQPFPLQAGINYARQDYPTLAAARHQIVERARTQIQPKED
jgi:myo-inositol-1(or 4)-monophosphatase